MSNLDFDPREIIERRFAIDKAEHAYALSPEVVLDQPAALNYACDDLSRAWRLIFRRRFPSFTLASYCWPRTHKDVVKLTLLPRFGRVGWWALKRWPAQFDRLDVKQAIDMIVPHDKASVSFYMTKPNGGTQAHSRWDDMADNNQPVPYTCPNCNTTMIPGMGKL